VVTAGDGVITGSVTPGDGEVTPDDSVGNDEVLVVTEGESGGEAGDVTMTGAVEPGATARDGLSTAGRHPTARQQIPKIPSTGMNNEG
jgi:hypothetical protein